MKITMKSVLLISILAFVVSAASAMEGWLDNFPKAQEKAKQDKLMILAVFTGSDWCQPCMMLEKNILIKKDFISEAKKKYVLFNADFPRGKKLQPGIQVQNEALSEKYGVEGFPTVLILDANGKKLAEPDSLDPEEGVKEYLKGLDEALKKAK